MFSGAEATGDLCAVEGVRDSVVGGLQTPDARSGHRVLPDSSSDSDAAVLDSTEDSQRTTEPQSAAKVLLAGHHQPIVDPAKLYDWFSGVFAQVVSAWLLELWKPRWDDKVGSECLVLGVCF